MSTELALLTWLVGIVPAAMFCAVLSGYRESRSGKCWDEGEFKDVVAACLVWPLALAVISIVTLYRGGRFAGRGLGIYLGTRAKLRAERALSSSRLEARWATEAQAEVDQIAPDI
jgi:hypothetical protein